KVSLMLEILSRRFFLKLNLSDHRSILTDLQGTLKGKWRYLIPAKPPIHNHVLIPNYQDFKIQDFCYSDGFECFQAIKIGSLGFGYTWRSSIKSCLSSSRASILVNGRLRSEFSINRGLRQGDPLSPFLFILVMEGLNNAFIEVVGNGLISGININNSTINISHLFFADDVIITTGWNARDLENVIRVLHVFYLDSGLKINMHKSNIYGIGVNEEEVYNMASNAGCSAGNIPFNYLGLPIGSNMKSTASRKVLVDRFRSRLSTWKANLLSIGDLLTLIKSVLGSLGIYYLSIFRAPELVLNDLEIIRSNFFGEVIKTARK
nr:reverse transcriptase domain, reverse transcriptase zinc-binding domain protein [Tanacetum cinerariifolium]